MIEKKISSLINASIQAKSKENWRTIVHGLSSTKKRQKAMVIVIVPKPMETKYTQYLYLKTYHTPYNKGMIYPNRINKAENT